MTASMLSLLSQVYKSEGFIRSVKDSLDYAPELKHENVVCTLISVELNRLGYKSEREVRKNGRRYDLQIEGERIEAKYHYEGDISQISLALKSAATDPIYLETELDRDYQSAPKDMLQLASRRDEDWLLWFVAVRRNTLDLPFRVKGIIPKFYKSVKAMNIDEAVAAAETKMDDAVENFFHLRDFNPSSHPLFPIITANGALLTRLIQLK